ncbi:MAG: hypothetical protein ABIF10_03905 [Candidatus Woesearchaeota archaeon]
MMEAAEGCDRIMEYFSRRSQAADQERQLADMLELSADLDRQERVKAKI